MTPPLLTLKNINKSYPLPGGGRRMIMNNVSLDLFTGEALGLLGKSGTGKSTLARIILGLDKPDQGTVMFDGKSVPFKNTPARRMHFRNIQIVWQDPTVYLNPYQSIIETIIEPMASFNIGSKKHHVRQAKTLMDLLNLPLSISDRRPSELSGGQCQRVALARALAVSPKLLICDEALVNLDLPQQVDIIKLLKLIRSETCLSLFFISHNRDIIKALCDRSVVLNQAHPN